MTETSESRHRELVRWVAVAGVAILAFGLGAWLFGGPAEQAHDPNADEQHEASVESVWTCSMHPQIRRSEAGQCPICGMDLIPVSADTGADPQPGERVTLSERARTLARVRTLPVQRLGHGAGERRLLGRVDYDESTLRTVTAWIAGRIDRLHVRVTGQRIGRGQVIASLYSPEVYSAHQDLLLAKQQLVRMSESSSATAREASSAALEASRDRLRLLGVPVAELADLERAERASERIRIRSPFGGTVIERLATEGGYVTTGTGLYRVADLSRLWVQLDAYESDLAALSVGQAVSLTVEAVPGETFEGRITFVDPVLSVRTRTSRVRVEVRNPEGHLRPGMFAEAIVAPSETATATPLVVPASAPLFTGRRSLVYVEIPNPNRPTYEARVVRLGAKSGEVYPVLEGLREGERVVVHGAFVLDADLQIQGGRSMMTLTEGAPDHSAAGHEAQPSPRDREAGPPSPAPTRMRSRPPDRHEHHPPGHGSP